MPKKSVKQSSVSTKKSPSAKKDLKAKLTWLPQKTFTLEFSLPWSQVKSTYDQVLKQLAKEAKVEGFRPGKAPLKLVEKSLDKGRLYGEVVNQLLPLAYAQAVKQHQLRPAVAPKVQIVSAEENQPWQFKATACEIPQVKLGDYPAIAKGALAQAKIWTPDKGDPGKEDKQKEVTPTQKLNQITQAFLKEIKLELPAMLVESERDRLLSKLLDQIQKLGLTLEQYAASNQKTVDQIRQEHQQMAANSLKIELILQAIATDRKIKVDDKDIDKMIQSAGDDKLKKQLDTPSERAYIASVLRKRQAIDYLLSL